MLKAMLLILLLCLISTDPSITVCAQTQSTLSSEIGDPKFDPFGGYSILGRVPKGFEDFGSFQLDLISKPVKGQPLKVAGGVYTLTDNPFLQFNSLNLTSTRLGFVTESKGSVTYNFEGRFLRRGSLSRFSKKVAVLGGVLRKVVDGRKVAEGQVRFSYFEPD